MKTALLALCFAASAQAQIVGRVVVTASAPMTGDSSDHVDVRVGQSAFFTARAYDVAGRLMTGRVFTWGTTATGTATVNAGKVTGRAIGAAYVTATTGGVRGVATACVTPDSVVSLPDVFVAGVTPTWTNSDSTPAFVRVELDVNVSNTTMRKLNAIQCVHWLLNGGSATPDGPGPRARMGHDGVVTLLDALTQFYPSASVGPTLPTANFNRTAHQQFSVSVTVRR